MKVPVWINIEEERNVEVSLEDIVSCIIEDVDSKQHIIKGLNNVVQFLRAIPDFSIKEFTETQRKTVQHVLIEQARRFN